MRRGRACALVVASLIKSGTCWKSRDCVGPRLIVSYSGWFCPRRERSETPRLKAKWLDEHQSTWTESMLFTVQHRRLRWPRVLGACFQNWVLAERREPYLVATCLHPLAEGRGLEAVEIAEEACHPDCDEDDSPSHEFELRGRQAPDCSCQRFRVSQKLAGRDQRQSCRCGRCPSTLERKSGQQWTTVGVRWEPSRDRAQHPSC